MQSHLFKALPFELDYFQGEISSESSAIKPWVRLINTLMAKRKYTIKPKSYLPTTIKTNTNITKEVNHSLTSEPKKQLKAKLN